MIELRLLGALDLTGATPDASAMLLRQPKRLALLSYLAMTTWSAFERRDRLLTLFWPELDELRARRGLRQSLHVLRSALGAEVIDRRGDAEVALRTDMLRCDAADVEALLEAGRLEEGVNAYRGDLMPGFHLADAPEFERWLDETRTGLRWRVARAAQSLSRSAEAAAALDDAAAWTRRASDLVPEDEALLRRLVTLLDRVGDRTGALRAYAAFERHLRDELQVTPAADTVALVARLRGVTIAPAVVSSPAQPAPSVEPVVRVLASAPAPTPAAAQRQRWVRMAGFAAAAIVVVAVLARYSAMGDAPDAAGRPEPAPLPGRARAQLLYQQGQLAWSGGDVAGAEQLMRAALDNDSTFALARLQLGHLLGQRGEHAAGQRLQQAAAGAAATQSDHDRLLILALFADRFSDPSQAAVAETLAIRYPGDLEGLLLVARARRNEGRFAAAVGPPARVIATPASPSGSADRCLRCEAYRLLVVTYEALDSVAAVERTARAWVAERPADADAWAVLSYQLATQHRFQDALAALRRAEDLRAGSTGANGLGEVLLRAGDFRTLDDIIQHRIRTGNTGDEFAARFLQWKSLREQGRMQDARAAAMALERDTRTIASAHDLAVTLHAQSLQDVGRYAEAAAVWDSLGRLPVNVSEPASSRAAASASRLAHLAAAVAGLRDTMRLERLADSVERLGNASGWDRNRRLHRYVRGHLSVIRGAYDEACTEFLGALNSATATFVRANLAAGDACLRSSRPADALRAVRGVLRGPVGAAGTWGTLSEAHELAARAFTAIGLRDSASAHHQRVADAWKSADPPFRERAQAALRAAGAVPATRADFSRQLR